VGSVGYELSLGAFYLALLGNVAQDRQGTVLQGSGPDLDDSIWKAGS
jgi:hypothetical protein